METRLIINRPELDNPLVIARLREDQYPRIAKIPKENATLLLMDILSKAYLFKGYRPDADNIKFLAETLYDEILLDQSGLGMKWISMFEIGYAIKKAVMNDDEFFFSVSHLYKILRNYCKGEGTKAHQEAKRITSESKENPALRAMIDSFAGRLMIASKNR